ncbi:MAG: glycosyltransferase family 4 protein [Pedobacter sp.]|nr:glycosyltransferase family 4 protein [Chitinophagaceae bacterium]
MIGKNDKNILLISSEFPPNVGGIGNHAFNVAKYLSLNGFKVQVLADIIDIHNQTFSKFQSGLSFKLYPVFRQKMVVITYWQRIKKAIQLSQKSDVIICSGKFQLWLILLLKIVATNKKFLAIVHGSELDLKQVWAKKLTDKSLLKFDAIIAVSHFTASLLSKAVKTKNNTTIIHNGINNNEFKNSNNQPLKGTPSIITIGSVTERKGQENVIFALPNLLKKFPQLHYHIVGKPVIQSQLQNLAKNLEVADAVTFHGIVERLTLIDLLAASNVKMMLSNYTADGDFEGFGIGIIEANALAKPAIGSKLGGIPDAINDTVSGRLVDPKNVEEITAALQDIMANYSAYSTQALQWAKQHDWAILIHQYINVIYQTCNV